MSVPLFFSSAAAAHSILILPHRDISAGPGGNTRSSALLLTDHIPAPVSVVRLIVEDESMRAAALALRDAG
jgi:hypothetical protein